MHGDGAQDLAAARRFTGAVTARIIGIADLEAIAEEWSDLASNAAEPNAFYAPAMLLPALAAFAEDGPEVVLVRDDRRRLIGLAPVAPLRGYSRLPVRYAGTWMHKHCFFSAPLVRPGYEHAFFKAFFDLNERRGAFLRLRHLDAEGPLYAAALAVAAETGRLAAPSARYARAMLKAPWTTDDYLKLSLNGKRRKELRRRRVRLQEAGDLRFEVSRRDDNFAAWAEEFLILEASGWKGRAGTAMRQDPASTRFFKEAVRRASDAGEVFFFRLALGDRALAAAVNFQSGPVSYAFKIAYDEEYERYSPGVMMEVDVMDALESAPNLAFVDSCAKTRHPMIDRLWRGRRAISALNISRRDAPSKALFRLLTMLEAASEKARARRDRSAELNGDDDL